MFRCQISERERCLFFVICRQSSFARNWKLKLISVADYGTRWLSANYSMEEKFKLYQNYFAQSAREMVVNLRRQPFGEK